MIFKFVKVDINTLEKIRIFIPATITSRGKITLHKYSGTNQPYRAMSDPYAQTDLDDANNNLDKAVIQIKKLFPYAEDDDLAELAG